MKIAMDVDADSSDAGLEGKPCIDLSDASVLLFGDQYAYKFKNPMKIKIDSKLAKR